MVTMLGSPKHCRDGVTRREAPRIVPLAPVAWPGIGMPDLRAAYLKNDPARPPYPR